MVDTAVADDIPADCTITSDNYEAGVIIGKYFLQKHNTAKLVVMTHESVRSAGERVGGFLDTVSANENIQVVKKIECEGQVEIAMPRLQEAIDEGFDFDTVFCLNDLAGMWKTWKRKSAERLCRRCFCENGLRAGLQGVPGGAWGAKGSLRCPAGREKTGKKRENPRRAGHRRRKRAVMPRRQRKNREEESEAGGAWRSKGSLWCPAAKEKTGKKRGNPRRAGHGRRKRAVVPRRQRKSMEEERKSEPGGAQGAKGSLWCPAAKEKTGKKRENPSRAGHGEQKEALIPRLPSINRPA